MHLLSSQLLQYLCVLPQLSAAHYGVVAEEASLAFEHVLVGAELHFCHEVAYVLVGGHEGAWPCGCVLADASLVGCLVACAVAYGHAYA